MNVPVTKADVANARTGVYECAECDKEIERQKACGLDCAEEELRNQHLMRFYQALIDQYAPLVAPATRDR